MKFSVFSMFVSAWLILISCSKSGAGVDDDTALPPPETDEVPTTEYDVSQLTFCTLFELAPKVTLVQRQDYNELSGIAASAKNPGILYMHNDGKNSPILISNAAGEDLGKIMLDGKSTVNPEDICVGPGPEAGKSYVYLADIGDNNKSRASITVYRLEEPTLNKPTSSTEIHIGDVSTIVLKYPTAAYNAEALLVDPITKDLFVATKEVNRSTLYRAAYPQSETTINTMEPMLNMRFFDLITSGDISADGKEILLRNKAQIWYWSRDTQKGIVDVLLTAPQEAPYAGNEHQGEGIGFAVDNSGYFTNTETRDYPGAQSAISFYSRK